MTAYYNEIDPFAAAWLRELIARSLIAPGDVDERSIEDVNPDDLRPYTQCHFFAGIGVWSHALRRAGWPDDRSVWTGSCPCQPFSAAGKGGGFDDERHLWPAFNHLIVECHPDRVLGEQVASKDGLAWLDLVSADMEEAGYAFGALDICAAGFGAPHIRQRTWWVADAAESGRGEQPERNARTNGRATTESGRLHFAGGLADADDARSQRWSERRNGANQCATGPLGLAGGVEHADSHQSPQVARDADEVRRLPQTQRQPEHSAALSVRGSGAHRPGPINGLWRDADWLWCRDGKWRPVEPGTFPLAHGAANRVGRLRGYGNAIPAPVAQGFVESVMAWDNVKELLDD